MKLSMRMTVILVLLAVGLVGQFLLQRHLAAAAIAPEDQGGIVRELASLPLEIGDWRGRDVEITNPNEIYGDERVKRIYVNEELGVGVTLWMAYSREGEDRLHHPEVCMAAVRRPEDMAGRQFIEVEGHESPVQQYLFGTQDDKTFVYYWHYSYALDDAGLDGVQKLYRKLRYRPSSVTIEVFAGGSKPSWEGAIAFVRALDAELQDIVGPDAKRGCGRVPVVLITE